MNTVNANNYVYTKVESLIELRDVYVHCNEDNWGGNGEEAITRDVYHNIKRLIEDLPEGTDIPDISAERDGSLNLDWATSLDDYLSVSVTSDGIVHYCAEIDGVRESGEYPLPCSVSNDLLGLVKSVTCE